MTSFTLNGEAVSVEVDPQTPLLWVLRDTLGLTGTKFGCGIAQCGACTVHLDGKATRSCVTPVTKAEGKAITTIEAIADDDVGKRVQEAWLELGVAQCGYCQGGQIMTATALLKENGSPDGAEIRDAMNGNLCRCGTYNRIEAAVARAADMEDKA